MDKLYLIILLLFVIYSCKNKDDKYDIDESCCMDFIINGSSDTIQLYPDQYRYIINVVVNKDTIKAIIDTGADISVFPEYLNSKEKETYIEGTNIAGINIKMKNVIIDSLRIGNSTIYSNGGFGCFHNNAIIGGDILSQAIWKIDNVNNRIIVTKDTLMFKEDEYNSCKIPLFRIGSRFIVRGYISENIYDFLFDTGFPDFANIFEPSMIINIPEYPLDTILWLDSSSEKDTLSISDYGCDLNKIDSIYYTIEDFKIGDIISDNEIIINNIAKRNLLGMDFCRRFDYVIIDYVRNKMFLGAYNYKSDRYLAALRGRINSLGFRCSLTNPPIITSVSKELFDKGLCIGDTIMLIDDIPVEQNSDLLDLSIESCTRPVKSINRILYRVDSVRITVKDCKDSFLKNYSLERKHYVEGPDTTIVYNPVSVSPLSSLIKYYYVSESMKRQCYKILYINEK